MRVARARDSVSWFHLGSVIGRSAMPRGASPKREKEYEELKSEFKKEGRYKGREEEVASRIVNKQRAQFGETKREKQKDREGKSPDRNLPIRNYQHLTMSEGKKKIEDLSKSELKKVESYESKHKDRKGVHDAIERARAA